MFFIERASRLRTADIWNATPSAPRTEECQLQISENAESDPPPIANSFEFAPGRSQPAAIARANGAKRQ
jgi:hypothetical protein